MDPSKVTLTEEDIRKRVGLFQGVIEGRRARIRGTFDALTNAAMEGSLEFFLPYLGITAERSLCTTYG